jgi:chemotaxis protein MotB
MAKKKRHEEEPENQERWLLTYADLITLLLGLFVILYAMSQMDKTKYQDFVSALTQRFGSKSVMAGHKGVLFQPAPKTGKAQAPQYSFKRDPRKQRLQNQLNALLKQQIGVGEVQINDTRNGVSIDLLESLLFASGSAVIKPEAYDSLNKITDFLMTLNNDIRVEGHTDDVPINTAQFPSNWHLSIARALNTGYYILQRGFPPERVSIAGYSEYQPLVPNDSSENRTKNRRVEIVILIGDLSVQPAYSLDDSLAVQ